MYDLRFYACRSDRYCFEEKNFIDFESAYNMYMGIAFNIMDSSLTRMYVACFNHNKIDTSSITILNYDSIKKFKHLFKVD